MDHILQDTSTEFSRFFESPSNAKIAKVPSILFDASAARSREDRFRPRQFHASQLFPWNSVIKFQETEGRYSPRGKGIRIYLKLN